MLREAHGERLLRALAKATPVSLTLADFNVDVPPPFQAIWLGKADETPGLVAAYICKDEAVKLALCIASRLPKMAGFFGYFEKDYLGLCKISEVYIEAMVDAAETVNESVVFYPSDFSGVILADCYESNPGDSFTIIVQGEALVNIVQECFGKNGHSAHQIVSSKKTAIRRSEVRPK